jgi:hypothetical protein
MEKKGRIKKLRKSAGRLTAPNFDSVDEMRDRSRILHHNHLSLSKLQK